MKAYQGSDGSFWKRTFYRLGEPTEHDVTEDMILEAAFDILKSRVSDMRDLEQRIEALERDR